MKQCFVVFYSRPESDEDEAFLGVHVTFDSARKAVEADAAEQGYVEGFRWGNGRAILNEKTEDPLIFAAWDEDDINAHGSYHVVETPLHGGRDDRYIFRRIHFPSEFVQYICYDSLEQLRRAVRGHVEIMQLGEGGLDVTVWGEK